MAAGDNQAETTTVELDSILKTYVLPRETIILYVLARSFHRSYPRFLKKNRKNSSRVYSLLSFGLRSPAT